MTLSVGLPSYVDNPMLKLHFIFLPYYTLNPISIR